MEKKVADMIPALQIEVTDAAEDWFYVIMGCKGKVSKELVGKTLKRMEGYSEDERAKGLMLAEKMEKNLDKYGIPCAAWAKKSPKMLPA